MLLLDLVFIEDSMLEQFLFGWMVLKRSVDLATSVTPRLLGPVIVDCSSIARILPLIINQGRGVPLSLVQLRLGVLVSYLVPHSHLRWCNSFLLGCEVHRHVSSLVEQLSASLVQTVRCLFCSAWSYYWNLSVLY